MWQEEEGEPSKEVEAEVETEKYNIKERQYGILIYSGDMK